MPAETSAPAEVVQADRELFKAIGSSEGWECSENSIDAGEWDNDGAMQAIARHRLNTRPPVDRDTETVEACAKVAEEYAADMAERSDRAIDAAGRMALVAQKRAGNNIAEKIRAMPTPKPTSPAPDHIGGVWMPGADEGENRRDG